MHQIEKFDLSYAKGTTTGLPKPLAGGLKLNTREMPVCANGRANGRDVELSYAMARGCVRLLRGDIASLELVGSDTDTSARGVHLVLSNGTSNAWAVIDDTSKALKLCGTPFGSELVNYNAGIAVGFFLMLHRDVYPDFASAVGKAVDANTDQDETCRALSIALMADELTLAVERMIDGDDPLGINSVLMDRESPQDLDATFDGGELLKKAFTSVESFEQLTGSSSEDIKAEEETIDTTFVGDLPDKLADCIRRGKHVLLTGPTATGKTLCVEEVCIKLGAPLTVIRGSEGLEDRDMIGATVVTTEVSSTGQIAPKTTFTYGPLPEAMILGRKQYELHTQELENARSENREPEFVPPSVLLVDEINRLQLRFQNFLVSALNVRKATSDYYLRIPDNNEEITCPERFLVVVAARNAGGAFTGTNPMDIALERRFYKKIDVDYLAGDPETALVIERTGLEKDLARILVKVASDTRYQLSQLKAPLDTDTLLKWAEELAYVKGANTHVTDQVLLDVARDTVFDIVLDRSERGGFDPAGEAILTDNISENWRDVFKEGGDTNCTGTTGTQ